MKRNMTMQTAKKLLKTIILAAGVMALIAGGICLVNYPLNKLRMDLTFLPDKTKQTELSVSQDGYYEIASAEDYCAFWNKVNSTEAGARGRLVADIYLNNTENYNQWSENPPENRSSAVNFFYGIFDGNGHTIYGLYSENGYGMVERNRGQIIGLTIKDSLIVGEAEEALGGICRENYRLISGCDFEGEICNREDKNAYLDKAAGICCENSGTIERCGFGGTFNVEWGWMEGRGAGICPDNKGQIEGCYNFTDLTDAPYMQNRFYAIADQKASSCFVLSDSGWLMSEAGQIIELSKEQENLIPALQERDLYSLLVEQKQTEGVSAFGEMLPWHPKDAGDDQSDFKELLSDELVKELIWEVFINKGGALDRLELTMEDERVCLSDGKEAVFIGIYPADYDSTQEYEDSCAGLWEQCRDILGERDENSWQHYTWHLGEVSVIGREFVLYRTGDERQGFFWKQDEMLYRIERKKSAAEASVIEDEETDPADTMEVLKERISSLPGRESDEEEETECAEQSMYEMMLWLLWGDQLPQDGAFWESFEIRDAVYRQLTGSKEGIPPWEDIEKIENLTVKEFDIISTLQDLKRLPDLKELSLEGNYKARVGFDLTKEEAPELRELYISNVELKDIAFLEQLPQLTSLYVISCGVKDISPVQSQKELTDISFYGNAIENIWPLRGCKKLKILSLSCNDIEDITALASLTRLEEIGLEKNRISNIEALQWLPNLKKVNFNNNQVSDLTPLARQTGLIGLGAYYNQISDVTPLEKLTELENLSLDDNDIQDISALKDMSKLEYLGLSYNKIKDFTPICGLNQLIYLSVGGNPGQNLGNLIFVPNLGIASGSFDADEELQQEAQGYLDRYYSEKELTAEDMVKGDLNGDGLEDVVVVGLSETNEDEVYDDRRKAYPFITQPDGGYKLVAPVRIYGPDTGGVYGDPYQGMLISDGRLVVQVYGGSSWRWGYTDIYEYENGEMAEKWELEIEHCTHTSGYNYRINNKENDSYRFYAIAGEWEQSTRKLLLADWDGSASAVARELEEKWRTLQEEEELVLPDVYARVYQPETIEGGYGYNYVIHDTFYETKQTPDEVLLAAAEKYFKEYRELPVACYATEEIKSNFDSLAGVKLPENFYFGFIEYGIPELLVYEGCSVNEDGSYTHKCSVWVAGEEDWLWDRDVYYNEAEGSWSEDD